MIILPFSGSSDALIAEDLLKTINIPNKKYRCTILEVLQITIHEVEHDHPINYVFLNTLIPNCWRTLSTIN